MTQYAIPNAHKKRKYAKSKSFFEYPTSLLNQNDADTMISD